MQQFSFLIFLSLLASACVQTSVMETDFTKQEGVYIVGYSTSPDMRKIFEDQLVKDLSELNIVAYPSYKDVEDITTSDAEQVVRLANLQKNAAIVVINQVTLGSEAKVVLDPNRMSPDHPNLLSFYEYTKSQANLAHDNSGTVFAEVNTFAIDGKKTRLVWSGVTWSFEADGAGGAINGISQMVAGEIGKLR